MCGAEEKVAFQGACPSTIGRIQDSEVVLSGNVTQKPSVDNDMISSTDGDLHCEAAGVLNTYFLSAFSSQWDEVDNVRSLYSITIPLTAATPWMPVITPHEHGTTHIAVPSDRFLMDWVSLEEDAKLLGDDFFSYPAYALQSIQLENWLPTHTINKIIQSGVVVPRYKSSTTVMLNFPNNPFSAVGDVMDIRIAKNKPDVSTYSSKATAYGSRVQLDILCIKLVLFCYLLCFVINGVSDQP